MTLTALPWPGGKSPHPTVRHLGDWIAGLLPAPAAGQHYMEPFAGMLGLLLRRQPAGIETANDANLDVVNWWRTVRCQSSALADLVDGVPHSAVEHSRALEVCAAPLAVLPPEGDLDRAAAWTVAVTQTTGSTYLKGATTWARRYDSSGGRRNVPGAVAADAIRHLRHRLRRVRLECGDAVELIARYGQHPTVMIYADPPYRQVPDYYDCPLDHDALDDALVSCRARVAVSGYPGDRDALEDAGWMRHTRAHVAACLGPGRSSTRRTECLWTNYTPDVVE